MYLKKLTEYINKIIVYSGISIKNNIIYLRKSKNINNKHYRSYEIVYVDLVNYIINNNLVNTLEQRIKDIINKLNLDTIYKTIISEINIIDKYENLLIINIYIYSIYKINKNKNIINNIQSYIPKYNILGKILEHNDKLLIIENINTKQKYILKIFKLYGSGYENEYKFLKILGDNNISPKLIENKIFDKYKLIIMDKLDGTLYDILDDINDKNVNIFSKTHIIDLIKQINENIYKMHQLGIAHLDLHENNIGYKYNIENDNYTWYIFDFDKSEYIDDYEGIEEVYINYYGDNGFYGEEYWNDDDNDNDDEKFDINKFINYDYYNWYNEITILPYIFINTKLNNDIMILINSIYNYPVYGIYKNNILLHTIIKLNYDLYFDVSGIHTKNAIIDIISRNMNINTEDLELDLVDINNYKLDNEFYSIYKTHINKAITKLKYLGL